MTLSTPSKGGWPNTSSTPGRQPTAGSAVSATTFQLRLKLLDAASLEVQPLGRALRAVQIDLFDAEGNPIRDANFFFAAALTVTLSDQEVQELGGPTAMLDEVVAGRLSIRRFRPSSGEWDSILTTHDFSRRTFTAFLSSFSTFALVWTGAPAATLTPEATPTPRTRTGGYSDALADGAGYADRHASSGDGATPTSTTTPTPTPTSTPVPPAEATATPTAPSTPVRPTATPTLVPAAVAATATPTPTSTAAPSAVPTATSTAEPLPTFEAPPEPRPQRSHWRTKAAA